MKKIISITLTFILLFQINLPCLAFGKTTSQNIEYIVYNVETKTESYLSIPQENNIKSSPGYEGDLEKIEQAYENYSNSMSHFNNASTFSIIGDDEREKNGAASFVPYCRICLLTITWRNGTTSHGTGWLYKRDRVATAGHCVYNSERGGWAAQIIVQPGRYNDVSPYGETRSTHMTSVQGWTEDEDVDYDFGLIALEEPIGDACGFFGYSIEDIAIGKKVTIMGYPADKSTGNIWCQWGMSGKITFSTFTRLFYTIDTAGGQSGSPIFKEDNTVIGVHTRGGTINNSGRRIDGTMFSLMQRF